MNNLFLSALKNKLRFTSPRGVSISTEQLWDISLEELDVIAIQLNKAVNEQGLSESFISRQSTNPKLILSLEVAKEVIKDRLETLQKNQEKAQRQQEVSLLKSIIAERKMTELKSSSIEDLEERLKKITGISEK